METDSYLSEGQKRRKRRRKYFYLVIGFLAAYLLFLGAVWTILRSPLFRVSSITVEGNTTVPADAVVTLLQSAALRDHSSWKALLGFRNMLIWPSELTADDLVFIPPLATVQVSKNYWFHTLTAHVTERQPLAIWCLVQAPDGPCYWFDVQGTVFAKAYDTEGSLMFAVHDYAQRRLGLNGKILSAPFTPNMISILNVIRESGIDAKEIALKELDLQEITVTTYGGPSLYFSLRFPATNDLAVLQSLMAKPSFGQLQYVDFRIENRAYYK